MNQLDFFKKTQEFQRRLGGEFDYDGLIEEADMAVKENSEITVKIKDILKDYRIQITQRDFQEGCVT